MYPVSEAFRAAIVAGDQRAVVEADVVLGGVVLGPLEILSGAVTVDGRRAGALRSLAMTVSPDDDAWGWLTTFGAEIAVRRGLTIAGVDELVPLGVFCVDADLTRNDGNEITVNAADRSQRISRARWTEPYTVVSGADVGTAVAGILTDRWPGVDVTFAAIGKTTGAQAVFVPGAQTDPWKDAKALMESAGFDLYFDGLGRACYRVVPDPADASPCAVYAGGELAVVLSEKLKADMGAAYNGVIATGEGTGLEAPVRGEAWDDDVTSPTYRYGPMGQVPLFFASPLLVTDTQAAMAAATRLAKIRGRVEQVSWSLLVNPAHEAFDVVELVDDTATRRRFMIDQAVIPLTAGDPMPATTRETRVTR